MAESSKHDLGKIPLSPMEWDWDSGAGIVDPTSPFATAAKKPPKSEFDSPSKRKEQFTPFQPPWVLQTSHSTPNSLFSGGGASQHNEEAKPPLQINGAITGSGSSATYMNRPGKSLILSSQAPKRKYSTRVERRVTKRRTNMSRYDTKHASEAMYGGVAKNQKRGTRSDRLRLEAPKSVASRGNKDQGFWDWMWSALSLGGTVPKKPPSDAGNSGTQSDSDDTKRDRYPRRGRRRYFLSDDESDSEVEQENSEVEQENSEVEQETGLGGGAFELFGDEENQNLSDKGCLKADKWKSQFKKLLLQYPPSRKSKDQLRVAVLDSGINLEHDDFLDHDRIIETKTFIGGSANVDKSGHGTHVAGIVLELTKNVDLYVGKIAESRVCGDVKPIAVAIRHAREVWDVDIISLSFGMDRSVSCIYNEIKKCIKNDIVVFAAASNEGGTLPRTYPGTHPSVICVYSATGEGNASSFNPNPADGEAFCAVGDCVKSSWPVSKSDKSGWRYMSGTSFATPVAVAIAAFMIGYTRKEMGERAWSVEPRSPDGVKKLFRLMHTKRGDYDWVSPARFFNEYRYDNDTIRGLIRHALNI